MIDLGLEELKEKVNKIELVMSCIKSAEGNIESYLRVFGGEEISIQNHTQKGNAIYLNGDRKQEIFELLLDFQYDIIKKYKLELESMI